MWKECIFVVGKRCIINGIGSAKENPCHNGIRSAKLSLILRIMMVICLFE